MEWLGRRLLLLVGYGICGSACLVLTLALLFQVWLLSPHPAPGTPSPPPGTQSCRRVGSLGYRPAPTDQGLSGSRSTPFTASIWWCWVFVCLILAPGDFPVGFLERVVTVTCVAGWVEVCPPGFVPAAVLSVGRWPTSSPGPRASRRILSASVESWSRRHPADGLTWAAA